MEANTHHVHIVLSNAAQLSKHVLSINKDKRFETGIQIMFREQRSNTGVGINRRSRMATGLLQRFGNEGGNVTEKLLFN